VCNWWSPTTTRVSKQPSLATFRGHPTRGAYCPLRQEPPRHGGPRQAQGARDGPQGDLRRSRPKTSPHHPRFGCRQMASEGQREGGRAPRRTHRGVPQQPRFPRESPQAHPHHERAGEAQSEEIKRRSRVVRIFPNERSCLRLVTALAVEQSEEWITGRRYLDMEELERHRLEEERGVEGVIAHGTMS
jgi:hypothetical protein